MRPTYIICGATFCQVKAQAISMRLRLRGLELLAVSEDKIEYKMSLITTSDHEALIPVHTNTGTCAAEQCYNYDNSETEKPLIARKHVPKKHIQNLTGLMRAIQVFNWKFAG